MRGNRFRPGDDGNVVVDLQETPATPPEEFGGDPRLGWQIAGGVLIFLGWGLAVVINALAHVLAPSGGMRLWWGVWVGPHMGGFAWIAVGIGLFTGAMGVVFLHLASESPRGPIVLPGYDYSSEKHP